MFGIVKAETLKLWRRKEFWCCLLIMLLPLFYFMCYTADFSYVINLIPIKQDALYLFSHMIWLSCEILIFPLFLALCAIHAHRGEMDNRSIRFYLQRVEKRSYIYIGKHFSIIASEIAITVGLLFVCIAGQQLIELSSLSVQAGNTVYLQEVLLVAASLMYLTSIVFVSFAISTVFSIEVSTGIMILAIVLITIIKEIPLMQVLSPMYYLNQLSGEQINGLTVGQSILGVGILSLAICIVSYKIGVHRFARIDI